MAPSRALRPPLADLFVTNLRLLDLDTLDDWPQITAETYLTKNGQVLNQKERIICTEWALFRLFEIWDPDQARYKLQPFFPPLEPIQSRNLRAALYRMLEDAKKHGTLGRETVLRRTMLDDCKSEKLLEVLVVFSTTVVRRFVAPELLNDRYHSLVVKLATSPILNIAQQGKLAPIVVTHRASLDTLLRRKADTRARCLTFAQLLQQKQQQLSSRMHACKKEEAAVNPPDAALRARVEREVFGNWPGSNNAAWPHTLLYGDETPAGDQPLKRSFQHVWDVVARGGALQPDPDAVGLVENLEQRVIDQKERLKKWQAFHDGLLHRLHEDATAQPVQNGTDLDAFNFESHQDIKVGFLGHNEQESSLLGLDGNPELEDIVSTLKKSLYEVSISKPTTGSTVPGEQSNVAGQKLGLLSNGGNNHFGQQIPILEFSDPSGSLSPSWTDGQAGKGLMNTRQLPLSNIFSPAKQPFLSKSNTGTQDPEYHRIDEGDSVNGDGEKQIDIDDFGMGVIPESSTNMNGGYNKSTSRMSLADRARMSMFQVNNGITQSSNLNPSSKQHSKEAVSATSLIMSTGQSVADRRASLLERTQQSMSNLAIAMSSATADPLPPQRSSRPRPSSTFQLSVKKQRQSFAAKDNVFPVNQFETPGRPRLGVDDEVTQKWRERNATPTEKLFSGDADYTSVFKSRPRLQRSPDPSVEGTPVIGEEEEYIGIEDDDEDWMGSSPLRGKG